MFRLVAFSILFCGARFVSLLFVKVIELSYLLEYLYYHSDFGSLLSLVIYTFVIFLEYVFN